MTALNKIIEDESLERSKNSWKEEMSRMIGEKKANKTYREFKRINKSTEEPNYVDEVINYKAFTDKKEIFCSNDYLNMSTHEKVIKASIHAAQVHGVGAGGTRNISGNSELTERLEAEIAHWHKKVVSIGLQILYHYLGRRSSVSILLCCKSFDTVNSSREIFSPLSGKVSKST